MLFNCNFLELKKNKTPIHYCRSNDAYTYGRLNFEHFIFYTTKQLQISTKTITEKPYRRLKNLMLH